MSTRFVYTHNKQRSKEYQSVFFCTLAGAKLVKKGNRDYRVRVNEGVRGPTRKWWPSVLKIRRRLKVAPLASNVNLELLLHGEEQDQVRFRKIEIAPPVPDLGCSPLLEEIHAAVWRRFPNDVRSGGRFLCRFISGTWTVSRHGYRETPNVGWLGAAEDIFVSKPDSMDHLKEVAFFIVAETNNGNLRAARVIVGDQTWTPHDGWNHYSGVYHTHVHVEVEGGVPCSP